MKTAYGTLLGIGIVLGAQEARAQEGGDDPNYGFMGGNFHLEGGAGVYQVIGTNEMVTGIYPRFGVEFGLGTHIAIPVIARLSTSLAEGEPDMSQVSISTGLLVRFKEAEWPIALAVGAGMRAGAFTARPELVGLPSATPTEEVAGFPLTPEATLKVEFWLTKWLPIKAGFTYAPVFIEGVTVNTLEESLTAAIVF